MLAYSDITQAKVNRNAYGVLSAQGIAIASGGGNPSVGRRTTIEAEMIDKTVLESIDFRFEAATITSTAVTAAAKLLSGYTWAGAQNVENYFELAFQLILTETGREIQTKYLDSGIADTVSLINSILSATFTAADYDAIIPLVENLEPRNFGDTIQQSDVFSYVQSNVDGIDYMTISVFGTGFPLVLSADEITTPGVLSLSEIP